MLTAFFCLALSITVPVLTRWQETESVEFNRINDLWEAKSVRLWEELIPKANKGD
jgi:hypothetical protein